MDIPVCRQKNWFSMYNIPIMIKNSRAVEMMTHAFNRDVASINVQDGRHVAEQRLRDSVL